MKRIVYWILIMVFLPVSFEPLLALLAGKV